MSSIKFNKNRFAKKVSVVLTGFGSGAMWAAGAIAAMNTKYHPVIKAVYFVGSMATGVLLQRVTQREAEELIDNVWPEDESNVEFTYDTTYEQREETGSY